MALRGWRVVAGVAGVSALLLLAGIGAWRHLLRPRAANSAPATAGAAFARAWQDGHLEIAPWDGDGDQGRAAFSAWTAGMAVAGSEHPSSVTTRGTQRHGDQAHIALHITWRLSGGHLWSYDSDLPLRLANGRWGVVAQAATVHPRLATEQRLLATVLPGARAEILGGDGKALIADRDVVAVGLEPSRTKNLPDSVRQTAAILATAGAPVDPAALLARAQAAKSDSLVEVVTLRLATYTQVRAQLQSIPGTVFRQDTRPLAPTPEFARALLGTVGPATAEVVNKSGGRVHAGDETGIDGLEAQFQDQLAGHDGVRVQALPAASGAPGAPVSVDPGRSTLYEAPATAGRPLGLTIDPATQQAADDALKTAPKPAALVAVRASTGEVLAVANGGAGGGGAYDRALLGQYPPGSTFKIASALALLRQGTKSTDTVACPATTIVDGKSFKNAEAHVLGPVSFSTDFAQSCNTAFVNSAGRINQQQLHDAARDLGYEPYQLGVASADVEVPTDGTAVEHAAAMIGQGELLVNPLSVAVSAASVASGRHVIPRLLTDRPVPSGAPLDSGQVQALQALMRNTITSGTGEALAASPGGAVFGKTGTAEYGSDIPPQTHAWFAGFQGDVAFAVLVEDGGFGAQTAVPVAAQFLAALHAH